MSDLFDPATITARREKLTWRGRGEAWATVERPCVERKWPTTY